MLSCIVCVIFWETATVFHGDCVFFFFFNLAPFTFPPTVYKGSSFFTSLPTNYFMFFFGFFLLCCVSSSAVSLQCWYVSQISDLETLSSAFWPFVYYLLWRNICSGSPPPFFCHAVWHVRSSFPKQGSNPCPPALGARNVNPWMDREIFSFVHFKIVFYF